MERFDRTFDLDREHFKVKKLWMRKELRKEGKSGCHEKSVKLSNTSWTMQETNLLIELYADHNNYYISEVLQKTKASIDIRASTLGLKKSEYHRKKVNQLNNQKKHHAWTEEEIEILKANYKIKSYNEIGEELGRTGSAVSQKARKLNLIKNMKLWKD